MAIITLTTDFGTRDGYVGAMKGVLAARGARDTTVIDITHDVAPGDVAHAAWVVRTTCHEFPPWTNHVVVVDPGVGGARAGVIVQVQDHRYIGPDNGVFAYVASPSDPAWAIEHRRFRAARVSPTFHGRDVFAHAAAVLARGELLPSAAGSSVRLAGALPWGPRPPGQGRVVHVDRFGNLVTDLPAAEAGQAVALSRYTLPLAGTYEDVAPGELLAYIGSAGTVEIAVRDGSADRHIARAPLGLPDDLRGTPVVPLSDGGATPSAGPYR